MAYEQTKLVELVDRAVNHRWSIPEFQRVLYGINTSA